MNNFILIQAIGIAFASIGIYAGPELVLPPNDQILAFLQSVGFPAWAGVVAWGVMRVTSMISDISTRMEKHQMDTDNRLTKMEIYTQFKPPPDHSSIDGV